MRAPFPYEEIFISRDLGLRGSWWRVATDLGQNRKEMIILMDRTDNKEDSSLTEMATDGDQESLQNATDLLD